MKTTSAVLATLVATLVVATLHAQVEERPLPRLVKETDASLCSWTARRI